MADTSAQQSNSPSAVTPSEGSGVPTTQALQSSQFPLNLSLEGIAAGFPAVPFSQSSYPGFQAEVQTLSEYFTTATYNNIRVSGAAEGPYTINSGPTCSPVTVNEAQGAAQTAGVDQSQVTNLLVEIPYVSACGAVNGFTNGTQSLVDNSVASVGAKELGAQLIAQTAAGLNGDGGTGQVCSSGTWPSGDCQPAGQFTDGFSPIQSSAPLVYPHAVQGYAMGYLNSNDVRTINGMPVEVVDGIPVTGITIEPLQNQGSGTIGVRIPLDSNGNSYFFLENRTPTTPDGLDNSLSATNKLVGGVIDSSGDVSIVMLNPAQSGQPSGQQLSDPGLPLNTKVTLPNGTTVLADRVNSDGSIHVVIEPAATVINSCGPTGICAYTGGGVPVLPEGPVTLTTAGNGTCLDANGMDGNPTAQKTCGKDAAGETFQLNSADGSTYDIVNTASNLHIAPKATPPFQAPGPTLQQDGNASGQSGQLMTPSNISSESVVQTLQTEAPWAITKLPDGNFQIVAEGKCFTAPSPARAGSTPSPGEPRIDTEALRAAAAMPIAGKNESEQADTLQACTPGRLRQEWSIQPAEESLKVASELTTSVQPFSGSDIKPYLNMQEVPSGHTVAAPPRSVIPLQQTVQRSK